VKELGLLRVEGARMGLSGRLLLGIWVEDGSVCWWWARVDGWVEAGGDERTYRAAIIPTQAQAQGLGQRIG